MDHEAKTELMSVVDGLSPEARASIASLREDQVILLHFGLGGYIRNQIRQGRLPALFRWSRTQVPEHVKHLDDVTFPIHVEVWRLVNDASTPVDHQSCPDCLSRLYFKICSISARFMRPAVRRKAKWPEPHGGRAWEFSCAAAVRQVAWECQSADHDALVF
jgi:hypothetical protein